MNLKNVPLSRGVVADLYKYSLVNVQDYTGGNNKNILLLVNNSDARYLPYSQLIFLSGILSACKLCMDDIAIVNLYNKNTQNFINIAGVLKSEVIIVADIEISIPGLPFKIPPFQVQSYNGKKYVFIPSLQKIENDAVQKRRLWEILKVLFAV